MSDERTQKARVLSDLRAAGLRGVCSEEWYSRAIPNARNRVVELKRDGWCISSAPCGNDHGPGYFRYVIIHGPGRTCRVCRPVPEQLHLTAATR